MNTLPAKIPRLILKLSLKGLLFSCLFGQLCKKIDYGQTISYGTLAKMLESSVAHKVSPRAVGRAVGQNPIAILLPCHRVIGANGKLTGYAWGLERKAKLLEMERFKQ